MESKFFPVPAGVDAARFWDDLEWALGGHDLTDALAHDLAEGLENVSLKVKRLIEAPPARQLELAGNVAAAGREFQVALREYDAFRVAGGLEDPAAERSTFESLLQRLLDEAEYGLRGYLLDEGLVSRERARRGAPIDNPITLVALGAIDALDRHAIARAISNDGVTADVLRVMLRALDQMRGQEPKERKHLKRRISAWFLAVDRLRSEEESAPA